MNSGCIDLIATDPPFNKGRDFHADPESLAKGASFQDRWFWDKDVHPEWLEMLKDDQPRLLEAIEGARHAHSDGMGAFMCFLSVRLLEMRRVLKETGSLFLHCDPTASHYIKTCMDAIFGAKNFRNEMIWRRTLGSKPAGKRLGSNHDVILFYTKSEGATFHVPYLEKEDKPKPHYRYRDKDGRHYRLIALYSSAFLGGNLKYEYKGYTPPYGWRVSLEKLKALDADGLVAWNKNGRAEKKIYWDENPGKACDDLWLDINNLNPQAKERTGYPTQKPMALYERIISMSSNEGDVVLDPFCGCATTVVAAEKLKRKWIGMDLWKKAAKVTKGRMIDERLMIAGESAPTGKSHDLFAEDIEYIKADEIKPRTDNNQKAAAPFKTKIRYALEEPPGPKLSHAQMKKRLVAEHGLKCSGCDTHFNDPRHLELDHNTPRSDGGLNHISNRVLLCGPCNRAKSNNYTLSGLRKLNQKNGWMAEQAQKTAEQFDGKLG